MLSYCCFFTLHATLHRHKCHSFFLKQSVINPCEAGTLPSCRHSQTDCRLVLRWLRAGTCVASSACQTAAPSQHTPTRVKTHLRWENMNKKVPFNSFFAFRASVVKTRCVLFVRVQCLSETAPQRCTASPLCTFRTCPQQCFPRAFPASDWPERQTNQRARHAEAGLPAARRN